MSHRSCYAGDKECRDHVIKAHELGTIQYIEWLILIDRVQLSFIAGVLHGISYIQYPTICNTQRVCCPWRILQTDLTVRYAIHLMLCISQGGVHIRADPSLQDTPYAMHGTAYREGFG